MWDFEQSQRVTNGDNSMPEEGYELWLLRDELKSNLVAISFRYWSPEYLELAWIEAVKQYAALLGIPAYQPQKLERHVYNAILAWESNILLDPGNPVLVKQLALAYTAVGDIDFEISGWWGIFKRHPFQIIILKLLHKACLRKYKKSTRDISLLKFIKLCAMRLLADYADKRGIKHLDWWPLASEDDLMLLQPYIQKQLWENASTFSIYVLTRQERTGVSGYDWVSRPSLRDKMHLLPGSSHPQQTSSDAVLEQNYPEGSGQATLSSEDPLMATSGSPLHQNETVAHEPLELLLPRPPVDSPAAGAPEAGVLAAGQISVGAIAAIPEHVQLHNMPPPSRVDQLADQDSPRYKVVPLALCFSNRLLEAKIIIQDCQIWDDRQVMKAIQGAYWDERGAWKKILTRMRIWPGKRLKHMGNAKVRLQLRVLTIFRCGYIRYRERMALSVIN
jgi:hypothetical protein